MVRNKRAIIIAAVAAVVLAAAAFLMWPRRGAPQHDEAQAALRPGRCPKLDGSYFSADKSQITKGESVELRYKVPGVYAPGVDIVGVVYPPPPTISTFTAGASASPLVTPTPLPEWYEERVPGVRPEKTITYTLKARGPEGCQPLELPATVRVK